MPGVGFSEFRRKPTPGIGFAVVAALLVAVAAGLAAQTPTAPDAAVKRIVDHPQLKQAMAVIDRDHDRLVAEIITLPRSPRRRSRKTGAAPPTSRCCASRA